MGYNADDQQWLHDKTPHYVPDPSDPSAGPTDLLPHVKKAFDAKKLCKAQGQRYATQQ